MLKKALGSAVTLAVIIILLAIGPISLTNPVESLHQTNAYGYGGGGGGSSAIMPGYLFTQNEPEEEAQLEESAKQPAQTVEEMAAAPEESPQEPESSGAEEVTSGLGGITGSVIENSTAESKSSYSLAGIVVIIALVAILAIVLIIKRRKK